MSEHMCCANSTLIFKPIIKKKEFIKQHAHTQNHMSLCEKNENHIGRRNKKDISTKNVTDCMILERIKYRK